MTYDNGLPITLEEFENFSYRKRSKFLKWMRGQKKLEEKQREQQKNN